MGHDNGAHRPLPEILPAFTAHFERNDDDDDDDDDDDAKREDKEKSVSMTSTGGARSSSKPSLCGLWPQSTGNGGVNGNSSATFNIASNVTELIGRSSPPLLTHQDRFHHTIKLTRRKKKKKTDTF